MGRVSGYALIIRFEEISGCADNELEFSLSSPSKRPRNIGAIIYMKAWYKKRSNRPFGMPESRSVPHPIRFVTALQVIY